MSRHVGLTQRGVQKIIAELEAAGYVARRKEGRCNSYTVHPQLPMRHPLERDHAVGDLLRALGCEPHKNEQAQTDGRGL
ncbi:MAG: hypothetical protein HY670_03360 [Chloroflexi bacterium]|nr:hypothetical protein [Chloroflexota bacterium]